MTQKNKIKSNKPKLQISITFAKCGRRKHLKCTCQTITSSILEVPRKIRRQVKFIARGFLENTSRVMEYPE